MGRRQGKEGHKSELKKSKSRARLYRVQLPGASGWVLMGFERDSQYLSCSSANQCQPKPVYRNTDDNSTT